MTSLQHLLNFAPTLGNLKSFQWTRNSGKLFPFLTNEKLSCLLSRCRHVGKREDPGDEVVKVICKTNE